MATDNGEKKGLFSRIRQGLTKTRESISGAMDSVFAGFSKLDDDFLEELEEVLVAADVGINATMEIMEALKERAKDERVSNSDGVRELLKELIFERITRDVGEDIMDARGKRVLLIVGVNGVGKTTAIGKLAHYYIERGEKPMLAAGDTFRAAAAEQLEEWGKRNGAPVIRHNEGADPSAVIFDALSSFKAKDMDVLICDTAGRLHNKKNLMNELTKMNSIIDRERGDIPRACYLVIDATTGQNGIEQARIFKECTGVDGIVLTKLDGTARGGVVVAIASELGIPVRFVGIGEGLGDLQPFDARAFVEALF